MRAKDGKIKADSPFELGRKAGATGAVECPFAPGSVERHNFEIGRRYAAEIDERQRRRA